MALSQTTIMRARQDGLSYVQPRDRRIYRATCYGHSSPGAIPASKLKNHIAAGVSPRATLLF